MVPSEEFLLFTSRFDPLFDFLGRGFSLETTRSVLKTVNAEKPTEVNAEKRTEDPYATIPRVSTKPAAKPASEGSRASALLDAGEVTKELQSKVEDVKAQQQELAQIKPDEVVVGVYNGQKVIKTATVQALCARLYSPSTEYNGIHIADGSARRGPCTPPHLPGLLEVLRAL